MSQGNWSIAISHRRLPFLGSLSIPREYIKGCSPGRSWDLPAVGSPGGAWRLGHFPRPGACEGFRVGNAGAVGGAVCGGGVEGDEREDEVGEEERADI